MAKPGFAVAIGSGAFFSDIFLYDPFDLARKGLRPQNAFDDRCPKSRGFVVGFQNRPGGTSAKSENARLLVERGVTESNQGLPQFSDLGDLSRLHG